MSAAGPPQGTRPPSGGGAQSVPGGGHTRGYRRAIDPSGEDSLAKLARWIRPGATVLELGCAAGYFTAHLASLGCTVDVVEIDERAAAEASRHARRTVIADLEGDAWMAELDGARYDAIVCADVIEHLRDGPRLMARLPALLAPGGELLLSVPNVAHSAVIASLVDDRFDYGGEGLLDPTHLHLYTWRSLAKLVHEAGFGILEWDATTLAPFDTEFRVRSEALAAGLREALLRRPRGFVYQWLLRAAPHAADRFAEPPATTVVERVPVRLLHADRPESLTLETAVVAQLPVGGEPTDLSWRWPAPAAALRLLLADRIGVVRVLDLELWRGNENVWRYDGNPESLVCDYAVVRLDARTFAVTAPDGWIAPAVDAPIALGADRMTATLAWPGDLAQSAEFSAVAALAEAHTRYVEESGRRHDALVELAHRHQRDRDGEVAAHAATRADRDRARAQLASLDASLGALRAENARLDAAVQAQERIIAYRQSARWWIALPFLRVKLWWRRVSRA